MIAERPGRMKTIDSTTILTTPEYRQFIEDLKARVTTARISAARAVNRDLILLYWDIGRAIVEKQQTLGWGESVVDRVSRDLKEAFPATTGFSPRNLRDMKRFYLAYSDEAIWPQAVAKLPVGTKTDNSEILRQAEPHRGGGVSTAVEIAERAEGKTADSKAAFRGRPRRTPTKGWQVTMRALTKTRSRFTGETYAGDCTD